MAATVLFGLVWFLDSWSGAALDVWLPDPAPPPPCQVRRTALSESGTLAVSDGWRVFVLSRGASAWKTVVTLHRSQSRQGGGQVTEMAFCANRLLVGHAAGLVVWSERTERRIAGPGGLTRLLGLSVAGRMVVAWSASLVWESPDCGLVWQSHSLVRAERLKAVAARGRWRVWLTDKGLSLSIGWSGLRYYQDMAGQEALVLAGMDSGPVVAVMGRGVVRILALATGRHLTRIVVPGHRLVQDPRGGLWVSDQGLVRIPPSGRAYRADMGLPPGAVLAVSRHQVFALARDGLYRREVVSLSHTRLRTRHACSVASPSFVRSGQRPHGLGALVPTLSLRAGVVSGNSFSGSLGSGWWMFGELSWRRSTYLDPGLQDIRIRIQRLRRRRALWWRRWSAACRRWKVLVERNLSESPAVRLDLRLGLERAAAMLQSRRGREP